jgi:hypothetical protein
MKNTQSNNTRKQQPLARSPLITVEVALTHTKMVAGLKMYRCVNSVLVKVVFRVRFSSIEHDFIRENGSYSLVFFFKTYNLLCRRYLKRHEKYFSGSNPEELAL